MAQPGGNLDYWDPALVNALAQSRRVIAFDNAGVGNSTGTTNLDSTPTSTTGMIRPV